MVSALSLKRQAKCLVVFLNLFCTTFLMPASPTDLGFVHVQDEAFPKALFLSIGIASGEESAIRFIGVVDAGDGPYVYRVDQAKLEDLSKRLEGVSGSGDATYQVADVADVANDGTVVLHTVSNVSGGSSSQQDHIIDASGEKKAYVVFQPGKWTDFLFSSIKIAAQDQVLVFDKNLNAISKLETHKSSGEPNKQSLSLLSDDIIVVSADISEDGAVFYVNENNELFSLVPVEGIYPDSGAKISVPEGVLVAKVSVAGDAVAVLSKSGSVWIANNPAVVEEWSDVGLEAVSEISISDNGHLAVIIKGDVFVGNLAKVAEVTQTFVDAVSGEATYEFVDVSSVEASGVIEKVLRATYSNGNTHDYNPLYDRTRKEGSFLPSDYEGYPKFFASIGVGSIVLVRDNSSVSTENRVSLLSWEDFKNDRLGTTLTGANVAGRLRNFVQLLASEAAGQAAIILLDDQGVLFMGNKNSGSINPVETGLYRFNSVELNDDDNDPSTDPVGLILEVNNPNLKSVGENQVAAVFSLSFEKLLAGEFVKEFSQGVSWSVPDVSIDNSNDFMILLKSVLEKSEKFTGEVTPTKEEIGNLFALFKKREIATQEQRLGKDVGNGFSDPLGVQDEPVENLYLALNNYLADGKLATYRDGIRVGLLRKKVSNLISGLKNRKKKLLGLRYLARPLGRKVSFDDVSTLAVTAEDGRVVTVPLAGEVTVDAVGSIMINGEVVENWPLGSDGNPLTWPTDEQGTPWLGTLRADQDGQLFVGEKSLQESGFQVVLNEAGEPTLVGVSLKVSIDMVTDLKASAEPLGPIALSSDDFYDSFFANDPQQFWLDGQRLGEAIVVLRDEWSLLEEAGELRSFHWQALQQILVQVGLRMDSQNHDVEGAEAVSPVRRRIRNKINGNPEFKKALKELEKTPEIMDPIFLQNDDFVFLKALDRQGVEQGALQKDENFGLSLEAEKPLVETLSNDALFQVRMVGNYFMICDPTSDDRDNPECLQVDPGSSALSFAEPSQPWSESFDDKSFLFSLRGSLDHLQIYSASGLPLKVNFDLSTVSLAHKQAMPAAFSVHLIEDGSSMHVLLEEELAGVDIAGIVKKAKDLVDAAASDQDRDDALKVLLRFRTARGTDANKNDWQKEITDSGLLIDDSLNQGLKDALASSVNSFVMESGKKAAILNLYKTGTRSLKVDDDGIVVASLGARDETSYFIVLKNENDSYSLKASNGKFLSHGAGLDQEGLFVANVDPDPNDPTLPSEEAATFDIDGTGEKIRIKLASVVDDNSGYLIVDSQGRLVDQDLDDPSSTGFDAGHGRGVFKIQTTGQSLAAELVGSVSDDQYPVMLKNSLVEAQRENNSLQFSQALIDFRNHLMEPAQSPQDATQGSSEMIPDVGFQVKISMEVLVEKVQKVRHVNSFGYETFDFAIPVLFGQIETWVSGGITLTKNGEIAFDNLQQLFGLKEPSFELSMVIDPQSFDYSRHGELKNFSSDNTFKTLEKFFYYNPDVYLDYLKSKIYLDSSPEVLISALDQDQGAKAQLLWRLSRLLMQSESWELSGSVISDLQAVMSSLSMTVLDASESLAVLDVEKTSEGDSGWYEDESNEGLLDALVIFNSALYSVDLALEKFEKGQLESIKLSANELEAVKEFLTNILQNNLFPLYVQDGNLSWAEIFELVSDDGEVVLTDEMRERGLEDKTLSILEEMIIQSRYVVARIDVALSILVAGPKVAVSLEVKKDYSQMSDIELNAEGSNLLSQAASLKGGGDQEAAILRIEEAKSVYNLLVSKGSVFAGSLSLAIQFANKEIFGGSIKAIGQTTKEGIGFAGSSSGSGSGKSVKISAVHES